ncbi:MAG TPA: hypothetical protein VGT40_21775 [Methylomirabilota bacterium]|jgi:hypothetical protein|nr:hypothetical protein [Methylomirabilota bacterium]
MPTKREVALRFSDKTAFGRFCVALSEGDVPFRLAGFRTAVLAEKDLRRLRGPLRELASIAETSPLTRRKKRPPLLSANETEELLGRMANRR